MPAEKTEATLRDFTDPARWSIDPADRDLFDRRLLDFVPPDAFDAHAHWYDQRHLLGADAQRIADPQVGHSAMVASMRRWMGERATTEGLYFGFPTRDVDCRAENQFVAEQVRANPGCRGLMLIRPDDDPAEVEGTLAEERFSGFKVYHLFARREDTFQAEPGEYLPEWAWDLAHQHGLWITLHLVLPGALSDPRNLAYIQQRCRAWPHANLVLAHAARGFNAAHTVEAVGALRGIDNVYFDSSAICEPAAFEAILRATGTTRLMYGSDFPVSELRGKAVSVGDGFVWLYQHNVAWDDWPHGRASVVGLESLLALRQACRTVCLRDGDVERIFRTNARQLLRIDPPPSGARVQEQYAHARRLIPGGTQLLSKRPEMYAPGHWPAYYEQAIGCEVVDTAGRRFIDMSSNGILACLLGFADPDVNAAVIRRVHLGSMSTQQTHDEVRLAELLLEIHPWAARARFARTGGEAAAMAVRIARAATGREKVAICGYHGWHDWYLAANLAEADSLAGHLLPGLEPAGVPAALRGTALPFRYNRLEELDAILAGHGHELAAVIMEPTRHTEPEAGFLEGVRERTRRAGARLIFDEISCGWRLCLGGAHLNYGVEPDLAVFAKTISNGYAMSAVIGNADTMSAAECSFISSAYWTEGIGPAAAVATIEKLRRLDVPAHIARIGTRCADGLRTLAQLARIPLTVAGRPEAVLLGFDHPDALALMTLLTTRMLDHGFLAASGFSPTLAHEPRHVDRFLAAAEMVFGELSEAIAAGDVMRRIGHRPRHAMFTRLAD
ncbi:MAG: aminotransferase class III-fold pyridoxal phosphate-dependent enzyme [Pirellulaceae bacterium]|nr:aminotransferase class III-fold pyridoxal phosphate-dependent enzyme [Pirellulaceae bacterium]